MKLLVHIYYLVSICKKKKNQNQFISVKGIYIIHHTLVKNKHHSKWHIHKINYSHILTS